MDKELPNKVIDLRGKKFGKVLVTELDGKYKRAYKWYGARGIKTSNEWLVFENFLKDMGSRPSKKHSVERIDVNGDYCKENCIWIVTSKQNSNKRNNVKIISGELTFNSTKECGEYFKYSLNI